MGSNEESTSKSSSSQRHIVLFPFMAKGHTIPLLQLARLILRRNIAAVTVLTTPKNHSFVVESLAGTSANVVILHFPDNSEGIPVGAESTEALPSMSLLASFANATEVMKPQFEWTVESLVPRVNFLISDGFLWWTQDSAERLGVPRLVFYGMSCYAMAVFADIAMSQALIQANQDQSDENNRPVIITVPSFPWIKVTPKDFDQTFEDPNTDATHSKFMENCWGATMRSSGMVVNSFREMESTFLDHWNRVCTPAAWCVGPLCLADSGKLDPDPRPRSLQFLDERLEEGKPVLYVAFGSQAEISPEQVVEIARGLEESGVDFLWVVRNTAVNEEFEERVRERGLVVREWADQKKILRHESVKGFMSHCGWNSVTDSLCAAVPILAWPLSADQPLNARMVTEELKIGARVVEAERVRGFVTWQEIAESAKEFMMRLSGDKAIFKVNVEMIALAAKNAVAEGGSSWKALKDLVEKTCMEKY